MESPAARPDGREERRQELRRTVVAVLIPLATFAVQWAFWPVIRPFVWFLFYPAVFLASGVGGFRSGLAATLLSAGLVWWCFIPPEYSWHKESIGNVLSVGVFVGMGVLFSVFHNRLRRATRQADEALAAARSANDRLQSANAQITQLYDRTLELDRIKTDFFANVSHELRTPLALILGPLARRLAAAEPGSEARRELEVADRNARLLHRQVNDLLDVAKLEAGRMELRYSQTDLARLVRLVAANFTSLAEEKRILFKLNTVAELPAQVDAEKCQRILLNLLANAFKFTPVGGAITVTLRAEEGRAVIAVQDNGPGVPEAMREAVFERFRQVEGGAQRSFGGTGLGLAIVKEFAALHGGAAKVEEPDGGGSLFTITLPLAAPAGVAVGAQAAALDEGLGRQAADELRAHYRTPAAARVGEDAPLILVVEDNPDMNTYIAETLRHHYRVVTAFDGEEGLHRALALRPDLVLSDVMMPRLSGDQLVAALRRHPEMADTPIVMLTAKADDVMRVKLLREGVQDYINKPFSEEELLARLGGLVAGRRRHAAALEEREERLRQAAAVFNSTQEGIVVTDKDANIIAVNPAFTTITEYTEAEVLGRNPRFLQSGRHDRSFYQQLWQAIEATGGWQGELWNRRKGGDIYPERLCVNVVRDEKGDVVHYVGVFADLTRFKHANHMEHMAHHDALTDLPNRLLLLSRLSHSLDRVRRYGGQGAVLFLDLDRFKPVNDSLGHAAGDEVLRLVAKRLGERLREADTLARLGGDEFVAVLEDLADRAEALGVAQNLVDLLAAPFTLADGRQVYIGGSVGIAFFPKDGDDAESLIRRADMALYQAKEAGRNGYRCYEAGSLPG